jgi:hypothetical protein
LPPLPVVPAVPCVPAVPVVPAEPCVPAEPVLPPELLQPEVEVVTLENRKPAPARPTIPKNALILVAFMSFSP